MRGLLVALLLFIATGISAQNSQLAQEYYRNGEYEKASVLYERLFEQNSRNFFFFERYMECLLVLEDFDNAESEIKKQLRRSDNNVSLFVLYGKLLETQFKEEEANEQYRRAIEELPREQYAIIRLANSFTSLTKYDLAIETFEKGAKLMKDDNIFAYNLGDLYRRKGKVKEMIYYYLNSIERTPRRVEYLKTVFQRYLLEEDYRELQKQLYTRIQKNRNATYFPELLTWVFVQQKDYRSALRQVKAMDRREGGNGERIFELGEIAANDKAYDSAIEAYEYIVESKGRSSAYYLEAKRQALICRRQKLVEGFDYTRDDLLKLEALYEDFLSEFGRSKVTAGIILELAKLEAFYLNDLPKAIDLLKQMIEFPQIDARLQAQAKLSLADYYLMRGERWESTLLYSQVDKDFKEDFLGNMARFKNAKLSYYTGEFEWAQSQFDILKASTSKLIANDALDLSVFIMDNLGLDSTETAMKLYSEADLLVFQNKFDDAFAKIDTLVEQFSKHSLNDDILYLKAQIAKRRRDYEKSAKILAQIVDTYSEEIRADNALFELAELYENRLDDKEKAKSLYEKLFIEFSNSTFAVEARKRYRILRGDNIQ